MNIGNEVYALVDDSTVLSGGNVELTATSTSTIDALTIGGAVAVGASGNKTVSHFQGPAQAPATRSGIRQKRLSRTAAR